MLYKTEHVIPSIKNYYSEQHVLEGKQQLGFNIQQKKSKPCEQQFQATYDYSILEKMNSVRQNRIVGLQIDFFHPIQALEETDCFSDVQNYVGNDQDLLRQQEESRKLIQIHFPYIRRVRGDGNCLFSSLIFPILETKYCNDGFEQMIKELQVQDIYWEGEILIKKEKAQELIKQMLVQFQTWKEKNVEFMIFSECLLNCANNKNGFYDLMIILIRSLAMNGLDKYHKQEPYVNYFLDEDDYVQYKRKLQIFEEEGDFLAICLISEITQVKIKVIQFRNAKPLQSMQQIEARINKNAKKSQESITLKFVDGHYDILYSKMFKQLKLPYQMPREQVFQLEFDVLY